MVPVSLLELPLLYNSQDEYPSPIKGAGKRVQ
jgi:hypothetical protein